MLRRRPTSIEARVVKNVLRELERVVCASSREEGVGVSAQAGALERMPVAVAAEERRVDMEASVVLSSVMRSAGVKVLVGGGDGDSPRVDDIVT